MIRLYVFEDCNAKFVDLHLDMQRCVKAETLEEALDLMRGTESGPCVENGVAYEVEITDSSAALTCGLLVAKHDYTIYRAQGRALDCIISLDEPSDERKS